MKEKKRRKYHNGDIVGVNSALLVLGRHAGKYTVQCLECVKDSELNGEAIYEHSDILRKLPCSCSHIPKWTEEQVRVLVKRHAIKNNYEFYSFVGQYKNTNETRVLIYCHKCDCTWNTCTISNFLRDRKCPNCAKEIRRQSRIIPDAVFVDNFRKSGMFPKEVFTFERVTNGGRKWRVHCSICNDYFISDKSNLKAGKVPCNCGTGGGYNKQLRGYFYILLCKINNEILVKFGITNFPKRRIVSHRRTLKDIKGTIEQCLLFHHDNGRIALLVETEVKNSVKIIDTGLDGFKREACSVSYLENIFKIVNDYNLSVVDNVVI